VPSRGYRIRPANRLFSSDPRIWRQSAAPCKGPSAPRLLHRNIELCYRVAMRTLRHLAAGLWLGAALAVSASAACAETATDRAVCTPSVVRLCPAEAMALDRDGAMRCLFRNIAKASRACQVVVASQSARASAAGRGAEARP